MEFRQTQSEMALEDLPSPTSNFLGAGVAVTNDDEKPLEMFPSLSLRKKRSKNRGLRPSHDLPINSRAASLRSLTQLSPPLTPMLSYDAFSFAAEPSPEPVFHNYLRAFYHFHPSSTVSSISEESSITVPINQGDVILVHSIHPNGWADGTLLESGARGWLPTNYCEAFDPASLRNLMNALTHLWDLVRNGEQDNLVAFTRQDYVRAMIAGVRSFLERTGCLSRESPLIVSHVALRRLRKHLLGDLSSMVKIAKQLQQTLQGNDASVPIYELLDELVLKAFKVVIRAVRFLDIWSQDVSPGVPFDFGEPLAEGGPPTPPAETREQDQAPGQESGNYSEQQDQEQAHDQQLAHPLEAPQPIETIPASFPTTQFESEPVRTVVPLQHRRIPSRNQLELQLPGRAITYHSALPLPPATAGATSSGGDPLPCALPAALSRQSCPAGPASAPPAPVQPQGHHHHHQHQYSHPAPIAAPGFQGVVPRPLSITAKRASVSHRLSYMPKTGAAGINRHNLASERLSAAHDAFLGLLGTFIGLHLQSRSAEELDATTHQSVIACQQLLAVVDQVWARDGRRSEPLQTARDTMHSRLSELVQATKDMFKATASGEQLLDPESGNHLVSSTTNCIRASGDCASKARSVIERIGDFEFENGPANLRQSIMTALEVQVEVPTPAEEVSDPVAELNVAEPAEDKPLPLPPTARELPPEPMSPPPPPPLNSSDGYKPLPEPPAVQSPISSAPMEFFSFRTSDSSVTLPLADSPPPPSLRSSRCSDPPLPVVPAEPAPVFNLAPLTNSPASSPELPSPEFFHRGARKDSSVADTDRSWRTSNPRGHDSTVSLASTRATTPDRSPILRDQGHPMLSSFGSISELQTLANEEAGLEEQMLERSYEHELIYNKDGQIIGGSLPALVEKLTTHDTTPDATFVTTFYLTFRLFTTPVDFAHSLIERFDYIGESPSISLPVRLRVYNVFKGWLETHWQPDADAAALPLIINFASGALASLMSAGPGKRLAELVAKVSESKNGALVPRLVSSLGKTSTSVTVHSDKPIEHPNVTKGQIAALRASRAGGPACSILDFDALELARQLTLIESHIFCNIGPEELLALEWTKKTGSRAVNVKAMSTLSTDLANLVADTILGLEEAKKRAVVIKQWIKIAGKCLELNNYDSLMAIICSLNSSMVLRLKKTWELISQKTKTKLENLKAVVDVGKNYAVLRARLSNHVAPCIPFVGIYLTDLTFVDVGNQTKRQLPDDGSGVVRSVINFDKHMKTAKIIGQLQRFQVAYRVAPVPDMQDWLHAQIERISTSNTANVQNYYRRSLWLEPRETPSAPISRAQSAVALNQLQDGDIHRPNQSLNSLNTKEKFHLWGLQFGSNSSSHVNTPIEEKFVSPM